LGFLSVIFIHSLDKEIYGYFHFLHSSATLLIPIFGLGIHGAIIRYAPIFEKRDASPHFLAFTLVITTICAMLSLLLVSSLYYIFYPYLNHLFKNFAETDKNKYIILSLALIFLYTTIFISFAASRYRIVVPDLINNVGLKIFLPVLILLYYFKHITETTFVYIVIIYFALIAVVLFIYVLNLSSHDRRPKLDTLQKTEYKGLFGFMLFSSLNGLGANLALRMDVVMIGLMISKEAVGIYFIIQVISNVMEIPNKAINQIASPVIAKSWVDEDTVNIQNIYQKSSVYGSIFAVFLFLMIYVIWPDIIALMPKGKDGLTLGLALSIFTFLGLARIVDIVTGVNSNIISYSKYYRFHMYFLVMLGLLNLGFNYVFLTKFGLVGAAMATFLAVLLFNIVKHAFVYFKFGFTLDKLPLIYIVGIGIFVFGIMYFVHLPLHPIVNILLKVIILVLFYGPLIWYTNPGGDIRSQLQNMLKDYKVYLPKMISKYLP
jgi:O-antigen/teichoic acid export membrane protein